MSSPRGPLDEVLDPPVDVVEDLLQLVALLDENLDAEARALLLEDLFETVESQELREGADHVRFTEFV